MKKIIILPLLVIILISGQAQKVYMKVEGTKSGIIKDQNMPPKFADKIELAGYSFQSSSSRDAASGMATGRRVRSPLSITKNNGQSSVLLFLASINNEQLRTVVIEVYKTNAQGADELEQTITLTGAVVNSFKQAYTSGAETGRATKTIMDAIEFTYQKITINYVNGGVMAEDSWNSN